MRSRITALILLTLLAACSETVDMPTTPQTSDAPLFSVGGTNCTSGTIGGRESFKCGRTHNVYFLSGDPLGQDLDALDDVEDAIDNWGEVLSDSNHHLPALTWAGGYSSADVAAESLTAIEVTYDTTGTGSYWCGDNSGKIITIQNTDSTSVGCSNGQATDNLVGLVMHEVTHSFVVNSKPVDDTDPTYEECQFTHYTYESPSHGHPSSVCTWDEQFLFEMFGLRSTEPNFSKPMVTGVTLSASEDSVRQGDDVIFTITATEDLGSWSSGSAGTFPKDWIVSGAGAFSPAPGSGSSSATVATDSSYGLGTVTVKVELVANSVVIWPEPEAADTVTVTTAVTSVTLDPASLLLTDVHADSLYQGIAATTSPVSGTSYAWSSSNENVARVISWGDTATVEGYSTGTTLISVLVDGEEADTATVTVQCGTKSNPSCIQYGPNPM